MGSDGGSELALSRDEPVAVGLAHTKLQQHWEATERGDVDAEQWRSPTVS